jgi:exosome complex component RRP46
VSARVSSRRAAANIRSAVVVGEGMERAEGRKGNQLRKYSCTRNPLGRAHGSARWEQGGTAVVAAVYGPRPGTRKGENPEKASVEVVWKPITGQSGQLPTTYLLQLWRSMAMLS